MAVSAAAYYEVRWRVKGAGEAWGDPRRVAPTAEIVIEELDRTQQYEFEVRAVSNCGAKSIWVPSDYTVPGTPAPPSVDTLTAQSLADGVHLGWTSIATPAAGIEYSVERSANGSSGWAERARLRATAYTDPETSGTRYYYRVRAANFAGQYGGYSPVVSNKGVAVGDIAANATNAAADAAAAKMQAQQANAELANIASDNMLASGEKTTVIRDYNVIIAEQAGIDAQAAAYGLTTQRTAYDNAITALTSYLNGLTSPTAWDNVTGDTAIVGATFRSRFATVYTTRQTLLNAIYAAAKAKADAAQSAADDAQATANTAQFLASQVAVINPGFDAGDTGWTKASGWSIKSDGSFGHGVGYAEKSGGASSAALRNNAVCFVQPGKSYTVQALIKAIGANGQCYARISWRDLNDGEIGTTNGNLVTGTTVEGSFATGQAPAGAVFAHAEIAATSHTAGRYQVDNVISTLQPATADEIAESGGRKWAAVSGADVTADAPKFLELNTSRSDTDNLVKKSRFEDGLAGAWPVNSVNTWGGTAQPNLTKFARINASAYLPATSEYLIPVQAGEVLYMQCDLTTYGMSTGGVYQRLQVRAADGTTVLGYLNGPTKAAGVGGSWETKSTLVTVPAGGAWILPGVTYSAGLGGTEYAGFANYRVYRSALLQPGSGARLGGTPNMPAVSVLNYGSSWTGLSITYTATTTSFTITVSAATLLSGSKTINYSSSSITRSGTAGAIYRENLYYNDPTFAGGARTLNATVDFNNVVSDDGNVFLGAIAVKLPTSGTSTGGGSSGSGDRCPDENAWVRRADPAGQVPDWCVRAKDVRVHDYLRLTNGRAGLVTYSRRVPSPRVRVLGRRGKSLTCSPSAPLERPEGAHVRAADAAGHDVRVLERTSLSSDVIAEVDVLPDGYVQHITCEDSDFWAGDAPDGLFAHHNLKPLPDL